MKFLKNNEINKKFSELESEIEEKKEKLNTLMKELLTCEKTFQESWDVIKGVIDMKKGRQACINGGKLINAFPADYIEQYQTIHSVC
jgi:sugar-specific transcriptional regulator TrmB